MKTKIKTSMGRKVFLAADVVTVVVLSVLCMIPLLNLLAISFSSSQAIIENKVTLFPVDFTLNAYEYVVQSRKFWTSVRVSLLRVLLGVPVNVLMTILAAYPLSKDPNQFRARRFYVAYMMIVMLFNGGLMPTYYVVAKTGLIDSVWSLVLPGAVPVFSCIVLLNFPGNSLGIRGIGKAGRSGTMDHTDKDLSAALKTVHSHGDIVQPGKSLEFLF